MALRLMLGIDRSHPRGDIRTNNADAAYLEAAALTGRVVEEPELSDLPLTGNVPRPVTSPSSKAVCSIFERARRENLVLEKLRKRTIYDDYSFQTSA